MRLRLLIVLVALVALGCVTSAGASNGATVAKFGYSFSDQNGAGSCSGVRITHAGQSSFIKDAESCNTTVAFYAPGVYDLAAPSFGGWCSDYDAQFNFCNLATAGTLTVTHNGDGTYTWDIVAYYSQP
jgi:hypothetical protein